MASILINSCRTGFFQAWTKEKHLDLSCTMTTIVVEEANNLVDIFLTMTWRTTYHVVSAWRSGVKDGNHSLPPIILVHDWRLSFRLFRLNTFDFPLRLHPVLYRRISYRIPARSSMGHHTLKIMVYILQITMIRPPRTRSSIRSSNDEAQEMS